MPDIPWGPGIVLPYSDLDTREFLKKVRELKELDAVLEGPGVRVEDVDKYLKDSGLTTTRETDA